MDRRRFLQLAAAASTVSLLESTTSASAYALTSQEWKADNLASEIITDWFYHLGSRSSFESMYTAAALALPPVVVGVGTALNALWSFLKDIGSGVIAAGLSDWLKSLASPQTKEQVIATTDDIKSNGFPREDRSKVFRNGVVNSLVLTDSNDVDICAPFFYINNSGTIQVRGPRIPMIEGPESLGFRSAATSMLKAGWGARKTQNSLLPLWALNQAGQPAVTFYKDSVEPVVYRTNGGYCGMGYSCDKELKKGILDIIALDKAENETFNGSLAIDLGQVADML